MGVELYGWVGGIGITVLMALPARAQTDVVSLARIRVNSAWNEERFLELSTGAKHTLAVRPDGSVECWGGGYAFTSPVPDAPEGTRFEQVAAGDSHSLALSDAGAVVAWGSNDYGQCRVPELSPGRRYVAIAAGGAHSLALIDDGRLAAFGRNHQGQCTVPPLPPGVTYVQVAAAGNHSMALRSDGQAVLWGESLYDLNEIPPAEPDNPYVQVSVGAWHSVLLRADGTAVGSGFDLEGQLRIPDPPAGTAYVEVRAGRNFTLTLRSDGDVRVWGYLAHFGNPIQAPEIPLGRSVVGTTASEDHALLLLDNGAFVALGYSYNWAACNLPRTPAGVDYVEVKHQIDDNEAGSLLSDGAIVFWGGDSFQSAVPALPPGVRYNDFEVGWSGGVALRDDGAVVAWGHDVGGQLNVPDPPPGAKFVDIARNNPVSLALASDGSIQVWGYDDWWTGLFDVPDLPAGTSYLSVSAEEAKALAMRSDGVIVGWGKDSFGNEIPAPQAPAGQTFAGLEAGEWAHVARTDQGGLAVWGSYCQGVCEAPLPPEGTAVVDAAAGHGEVYAVLDDGTVARLDWPSYDTWTRVDSPTEERHLAVTASKNHAFATVETPLCLGRVSSFCPPSPAAADSMSGRFQVLGCPDHDLTTLTFSVEELPAQSVGFFVYGDPAVGAPFGIGGLCIGGSVVRIPALFEAGPDGIVLYGVDVNAAPFVAADTAVLPGATRAFQYLYREHAQVRFTNAVEVTFAP